MVVVEYIFPFGFGSIYRYLDIACRCWYYQGIYNIYTLIYYISDAI